MERQVGGGEEPGSSRKDEARREGGDQVQKRTPHWVPEQGNLVHLVTDRLHTGPCARGLKGSTRMVFIAVCGLN